MAPLAMKQQTTITGGPSERIEALQQNPRSISITWGDGHRSEFHYLWLRYNCACQICGDPESGVGSLMLTDFPADICPQSVKVSDSGSVEIAWAPDGHRTQYAADWLRLYCYSDSARAERKFRPIHWGAGRKFDLPSVEFSKLMSDEDAKLHMLESLRDFGIVLVRNGPVERKTIESVAECVGSIHETLLLKRIRDVLIRPDVQMVTNTPVQLWPHTDQCYKYTPPGITFFSCLESAPKGGESTMADGFRIAEVLREEDPKAFKLLSTIPQQFHRHLVGVTAQYADAPPITLDEDGDIVGFRYAHRVTAAPLSLPGELIEPVYRATRKLVELMCNPKYWHSFVLAAGETVAFDNHRVLHGRTAYDPSSGRRHLLRCEVDREEFHSGLRLLLRKAGRKRDALMRFPSGTSARGDNPYITGKQN